MKIDRSVALLVCCASLCAPFGLASSLAFPLPESAAAENDPKAACSSSLPDAPDAALLEQTTARAAKSSIRRGSVPSLRLQTRPFSAVAVGLTAGIDGLGVDVATPLATKINLRASASFLNYSPKVTSNGIPIDAAISFRSIGAGVDFFPYHNGFHITPGATLYNGNHAGAVANIAGGTSFTINDADYVSSLADPVHGVFGVSFGRKLAPSLTMGFGNMLRRDSHWSMPVEFGFQYIGQPKFTLNLTGSVCDSDGDCSTVQSDAATITNLQQEQIKINNEISPLRFYPILKIGLGYRFGRNVKRDDWY